MATVGLRELSRETGKVIEDVQESGEPMLILRRGTPIAALVPVDAENRNRLLLEGLPSFIAERKAAEEGIAAGRTRPLSEVMAEAEAAEGDTAAEQAEVPSMYGAGASLEGNAPLSGKIVARLTELGEDLNTGELVEKIAIAPRGIDLKPAELERIRAINEELIGSLTAGAVVSALHQLRRVNENLVERLSAAGRLDGETLRVALEEWKGAEELGMPTLGELEAAEAAPAAEAVAESD
jgi:prevent-host-death family protein